MTTPTITEAQIKRAVDRYPVVVTGPFSRCKHPEAVLRWALGCKDATCRSLALNYVQSGHGACWNALCATMPVDGWLVWYKGDGTKKGG